MGTKISAFPAAGPIGGSEELAGLQGGSDVRIPLSAIAVGPTGATGAAGAAGGNTGDGSGCCGRLTGTTGVPVPTADASSIGTIYFCPFMGNYVDLHNGTSTWTRRTFTQLSLSISGVVADKNYDVFVYDNAGAAAMELGAAWTSDTVRSTALAFQDGVLVKSGATTRRYIGTIRANLSNQTIDTGFSASPQVGGKRFIYSYYHRRRRGMRVFDNTSSWPYLTATWRSANGTAANKCEFVIGVDEDIVEAILTAGAECSNNTVRGPNIAIGLDSTTTPTTMAAFLESFGSATIAAWMTAQFNGHVGAGYHSLNWLESGGNSASSFLGNYRGGQAGMTVSLMG